MHDLRHTCASWMIQAGVPMPVIQQHLGHESIQTTIGVYGNARELHLTGENRLVSWWSAGFGKRIGDVKTAVGVAICQVTPI